MKRNFVLLILVAVMTFVSAQVRAQSNILEKDVMSKKFTIFAERFGMNYFSFWEGPSLEDGQTGKNELGRPLDSGLSMFNLVSITYRLNQKYSFDLQNRLEWIHTEEREWRFQGLRAGVSGNFLSGKD